MNDAKYKSSLSSPRRNLIELMQRVNFGRIERLRVRAGEPEFAPPPKVIHKLKIGGENGPRPESSSNDFLLKHQAVELFKAIGRIGDGVLAIEVRHGLPFTVEIEHGTDTGACGHV